MDLGTDLTNVSDEWKQGHEAAAAVTGKDFVGLYGFEMTWSDGFGHINTFNTPGFESRSNSEFGNKSGSTEGYQNYYDKLVEVGSSPLPVQPPRHHLRRLPGLRLLRSPGGPAHHPH